MFDNTWNFGSLFTTVATGAVVAQTSYQVPRIVTEDSFLLVGILCLIGVVVGLGHALSSKVPIPPRRVVGKVLMSVGVSVTAAAVYHFKPGTDPLVVLALGSGLSVMGSGWLEEIIRKRTGTSHENSRQEHP